VHEEDVMGEFLTLLVIVYLVGIVVVLALAVQEPHSGTGPVPPLLERIQRELPVAASWPVTLYHRMMGGSAK
jgi:hypothetical protein